MLMGLGEWRGEDLAALGRFRSELSARLRAPWRAALQLHGLALRLGAWQGGGYAPPALPGGRMVRAGRGKAGAAPVVAGQAGRRAGGMPGRLAYAQWKRRLGFGWKSLGWKSLSGPDGPGPAVERVARRRPGAGCGAGVYAVPLAAPVGYALAGRAPRDPSPPALRLGRAARLALNMGRGTAPAGLARSFAPRARAAGFEGRDAGMKTAAPIAALRHLIRHEGREGGREEMPVRRMPVMAESSLPEPRHLAAGRELGAGRSAPEPGAAQGVPGQEFADALDDYFFRQSRLAPAGGAAFDPRLTPAWAGVKLPG